MDGISEEQAKQDKILLEPFNCIVNNHGKQTRLKYAQALNLWLKIKDEQFNIINDGMSILHNASLLIDDIQDNSDMRRGSPVAHHIFGLPSTLNAANYAMLYAVQKLLQLGHPQIANIFVEFASDVHRGQGIDIYWRENFICPTEEEYIQMVIGKTGSYFKVLHMLMQLCSDNKSDYSNLVKPLACYFQIRDDYCNLCSKEYADKKGFCEDITEGKFSFPIIHAIRNYPEDTKIRDILRQRTTDVEVKKECLQLLRNYGSLKYTKNVLEDLDKQLLEEINKHGKNPIFLEIFDSLRTWKDGID